MDLFAVLLLCTAFGLFVTAHVALVAALCAKRPRWRGLVALVVPPLAPYWGIAERRYVWSALWIAAALIYLVNLVAASS